MRIFVRLLKCIELSPWPGRRTGFSSKKSGAGVWTSSLDKGNLSGGHP